LHFFLTKKRGCLFITFFQMAGLAVALVALPIGGGCGCVLGVLGGVLLSVILRIMIAFHCLCGVGRHVDSFVFTVVCAIFGSILGIIVGVWYVGSLMLRQLSHGDVSFF
jgi:hypothetical protein